MGKTFTFKRVVKHLALGGLFTVSAVINMGQAFALSESGIEGVLTQNRVVVAVDGKETSAPADKVKPGDLIEYQVKYTNKGGAPVSNLNVTLPIPKGLELVAQTELPRGAKASLDGVTFEPTPLKRTVKRADGTEVVELIPLNQYRALRWQVGQLAAGKTAVMSARAKVDNGPFAVSQATVSAIASAIPTALVIPTITK